MIVTEATVDLVYTDQLYSIVNCSLMCVYAESDQYNNDTLV